MIDGVQTTMSPKPKSLNTPSLLPTMWMEEYILECIRCNPGIRMHEVKSIIDTVIQKLVEEDKIFIVKCSAEIPGQLLKIEHKFLFDVNCSITIPETHINQ